MKSLIEYAKSFITVPYKWGGNSPIFGYDCSGFIQEVLKSVGLDPAGDQSAQALYDHLSKKSISKKASAGCIAFFGESVHRITHVALVINDTQMIEAGGGGAEVTGIHIADSKSAFIRIRLLSNRNDCCAILFPDYPIWLLNEMINDRS